MANSGTPLARLALVFHPGTCRERQMTDLSQWDFAEEFTGVEAAALIIGCDPSSTALASTELVRVRVRRDYEALNGWYAGEVAKIFRFSAPQGPVKAQQDLQRRMFEILEDERKKQPIDRLESVRMQEMRAYGESETARMIDVFRGFSDRQASAYVLQRFSRQELSRWLKVIGMKSVYQFDLNRPETAQAPSRHWPWGEHHTELLGHLEAAAQGFWANYYPRNAKEKAPKNETIIYWLTTERKVSEAMAKAIATILRADGLRTGPRK